MASKIISVFIFSILQCGLVLSSTSLKSLCGRVKKAPISISELVTELRGEPIDHLEPHLTFIVMVESYGDHLYYLSKDLSEECSRTIRAVGLLMEYLAICEDVTRETNCELKAIALEFKNVDHLEEHPAELFCRRAEKIFAGNPNFSPSFEKAKQEAAKFNFGSHRPPYSRTLLKSVDFLGITFMDKWTVPELARIVAVGSFEDQFNISKVYDKRYHYFAKSCQALAQVEKFAHKIQSLYEKTIEKTVPEITVSNAIELTVSSLAEDGQWWLKNMMKSFYTYISADPILKKELERMAAIIGKGARKEDLDFSSM